MAAVKSDESSSSHLQQQLLGSLIRHPHFPFSGLFFLDRAAFAFHVRVFAL